MCPPMRAPWHHLANTIELMLSSDHPSPGMSFPLVIAPSHRGSVLHLIHASLGPPESITQTASQSLQPFLHSSWQKVPILYNERPSPKLPLSMEGSGPPSKCIITWTHPRPQPKRHLDRFSRFCTDDRRVSLYFTVGCPSPSKLSLPMGDVDPI